MTRNGLSKRHVWSAGAAALVLALAGCSRPPDSGDGEQPQRDERPSPAPREPERVADDLAVPWGIGFLPDGTALVTERDSARVLRVSPSGAVENLGEVPGVSPIGEGGLMGLAVSPEFESDSMVYAYLTSETDNRIVSMTYTSEDGLGDPEVVLDGIPRASNHNGGRIAFGPDGLLYAGTGDAGQGARAQDIESLGGKILRITPEGDPAPGNPFDTPVLSYGHRNVQGLAWDGRERLFAVEFGQNAYDEVNLIEAGGNYGWPDVEGIGDREDYIDPAVVWTPDEASPSGAAIADGALWVAALRGERLWRVPLVGDTADEPLGDPEAWYEGDYGRLRSVATTPDGEALWLTTSNRDGRGDPAGADDRVLRVPLGE